MAEARSETRPVAARDGEAGLAPGQSPRLTSTASRCRRREASLLADPSVMRTRPSRTGGRTSMIDTTSTRPRRPTATARPDAAPAPAARGRCRDRRRLRHPGRASPRRRTRRRRRWALQQAQRERRGVDDAVRAARGERPSRQQVGERRVRRERPRIELVALHAPDAGLQFADDVAARRQGSPGRSSSSSGTVSATAAAPADGGAIIPVSNIRSIVSMTTDAGAERHPPATRPSPGKRPIRGAGRGEHRHMTDIAREAQEARQDRHRRHGADHEPGQGAQRRRREERVGLPGWIRIHRPEPGHLADLSRAGRRQAAVRPLGHLHRALGSHVLRPGHRSQARGTRQAPSRT